SSAKRRGWDSNPRGACTPIGFQDRRLRPLGHPAGCEPRYRGPLVSASAPSPRPAHLTCNWSRVRGGYPWVPVHRPRRKDVRLMKQRALVVIGLAAVAAMLLSTGAPARRTASTAMQAPPVPNAAAIKAKYGGQSITFVGDSVGGGHVRDLALASRFSKDTGIKVN